MAVEDQAGERREWTVSGMDCGSCAIKVRGAVERLPGVSQVNIATMTERLSLTLDPARTPPERVVELVAAIAAGELDPWSGRFLRAGADDLVVSSEHDILDGVCLRLAGSVD